MLGVDEVFGVVGEQGGTGHKESRGRKDFEKAFHIFDEEWRRLVEVEGGVKVKHDGADILREALADFAELEYRLAESNGISTIRSLPRHNC